MMIQNKVKASRALWTWRLARMGEFPCRVEVVAVRGVDDQRLSEARQAVREMADDEDAPLTWIASEYVDVTAGDAEMAAWARAYAIEHGLSEAELPFKLQ